MITKNELIFTYELAEAHANSRLAEYGRKGKVLTEAARQTLVIDYLAHYLEHELLSLLSSGPDEGRNIQ